MHISPDEARQVLERWKAQGTPLLAHLSGRQKPVRAKLESLTGNTVQLTSGSENLVLDLQGAEFNGDDRAKNGAYLVCEFRNGDRCSLYAQEADSGKPREAKSDV
jgi:hypothetical protein